MKYLIFFVFIFSQLALAKDTILRHSGSHFSGAEYKQECIKEAETTIDRMKAHGLSLIPGNYCMSIEMRPPWRYIVAVKYNYVFAKGRVKEHHVSGLGRTMCMDLRKELNDKFEQNYTAFEKFNFISASCNHMSLHSPLSLNYLEKESYKEVKFYHHNNFELFLSKEDCLDKKAKLEKEYYENQKPWLFGRCIKIRSTSGDPHKLIFSYVE